jgi:hypothetical protein
MYMDHKKEPIIILEAISLKDLWVWHVFFGMSDSHNNINVLQRSPIFTRLAEVQGPQVNYSINCNDYSIGYYLADRIYPSWATFVKTIPEHLKVTRKNILPRHNKHVEMILNVRLEFYNLALLLFAGRLVCGMRSC